MRIGVDLDGPSYSFYSAFAHWAHKTTGRPLDEMPPAKRYEFFEDWGFTLDEFLRLFEDGVNAGFIFLHGDPVPGALPAVEALKAAGHSIHIVTDRFVGRRSHANTEEWLARHKFPYDSLTFSADKTIVRTDAFIDDNPKNVLALRGAGCAAFMLELGRSDQSGFPPEWTVSNWEDFVDKVGSLDNGKPSLCRVNS